MTNPTIIILAAGEGKRMNSSIPKVLHLFDNMPMLVKIINTVKTITPRNIIIITGKYDELIKKTVSEYMELDKLLFVKQQAPMGTGDAVKSCLSYLNSDDDVLILNGDTPLITSDILTKFIDNSSSVNLMVATMNEPHGYGRIVYDEDDNFKEIIEEKDCNETQRQIKIINSGIYLMKGELLITYVPFIDNNNSQKEYYLTDVLKIIKTNTQQHIRTYILDEHETKYISGVNTQDELASIHKYI